MEAFTYLAGAVAVSAIVALLFGAFAKRRRP